MTSIRRLIDIVVPRGALTLSLLLLATYGLGLLRNRVQSAAFGASVDFEAYVAAFRIPETAFDVVVAAGLAAPFVPIPCARPPIGCSVMPNSSAFWRMTSIWRREIGSGRPS